MTTENQRLDDELSQLLQRPSDGFENREQGESHIASLKYALKGFMQRNEGELITIRGQIERLSREKLTLTTQLSSAKTESERRKQQITKLEQGNDALGKEMRTLADEIRKLTDSETRLTRLYSEAVSERDRLRTELGKALASLEESTRELASVRELQSATALECDGYSRRASELTALLAEPLKRIRDLETCITEQNTLHGEQLETVAGLNLRTNELAAENMRLKDESSRLSAARSDASAEVREAASKNYRLMQEIAVLKNAALHAAKPRSSTSQLSAAILLTLLIVGGGAWLYHVRQMRTASTETQRLRLLLTGQAVQNFYSAADMETGFVNHVDSAGHRLGYRVEVNGVLRGIVIDQPRGSMVYGCATNGFIFLAHVPFRTSSYAALAAHGQELLPLFASGKNP